MGGRVEAASANNAGRDDVQPLLGLIRKLALELHPHREGDLRITLDTSLERDLGLDSLARVELFYRLEQTFEVSLADQLLASAETPRDLLRGLAGAVRGPRTETLDTASATILDAVETFPHDARTLTEVLDWHVRAHPERLHITFYEVPPEPDLSYGELQQGARRVAAGLARLGVDPGQAVAIMLTTGRDYLFSFFGVLLAGCIPVPIYPPFRLSQLEDHLRRHIGILSNALVQALISLDEAKPLAQLFRGEVKTLRHVVTVAELTAEGGDPPAVTIRPNDIAFLQYTSGSTGNPKGVVLTHQNLLANIRAMAKAIQVDSTDVFVSWLPLYHDMGLIGVWMGSLYYAIPLVLMSPLAFLARPERWLQAIHKHRGSLSAGVNFAYEICLNRIPDSALEGLDLSSWRYALNGAEPVSPDTLQRFADRFGPFGLRPEAIAPVYGLAECTVGLTFPPVGRGPLIDHVKREPLLREGRAVPADEGDQDTLRFVACGPPLVGHQVRVVGDSGHELAEREVGRLQFQGPSATTGYFRNPEATAALFDGEWLETGDLGYILGGDIVPTGRIKDVIIRAGRNIYPYELEEGVGNIPGIRKGCVAVFGSPDPRTGTERLVIVAETRERDRAQRVALREQIDHLSVELVGTPPEDVVLAPSHSVLKTSSGKIRRPAIRELYEQGAIGKGARGGWLVFVRLIPTALRRFRRPIATALYSAYAYAMFGTIALGAWSLTCLMPRSDWGWAVARRAARMVMRLSGSPLVVRGLENLPRKGAYVVVANHSSYLDSLVLAAALPVNLSFVAKRELVGNFIARVFLNRLGTEYVERFDWQRGVADARRIGKAVEKGRSLMFFPEGTFTRIPGLRPFHLGAFVTASEHGVPVIPIILRGTRSRLREGEWAPRRGPVSVQISSPLQPEGSDWAAAVRLRDAARAEILRHCGEPDLAV